MQGIDETAQVVVNRLVTSRGQDPFVVALVTGSKAFDPQTVRAALEDAAARLRLDLSITSLDEQRMCCTISGRTGRLRRSLPLRGWGAVAHSTITSAVGTPLWLGIGGMVETQEALARSFREATEALRVARLRSKDPVCILYEDSILEVIISSSAHAGRLASLLDPVLAHQKDGALTDTLQACFDEKFELTRAAERLHVHRHTVSYRLGLVEKLLGRSLQSSSDRLILQTALLARSLTAVR